ncbi:MAG: hypothetical protein MI743_13910 [Sneathiellales bacterium]|nr:hypothetical protein [Sneathiellales bacterium]
MTNTRMNNIVAKELSDAMARCKSSGVDEQSLRTGLLTITIANFINRIGMENTVALFEALPYEIQTGIFDRYIDPNTNTARSTPVAQRPMAPAPHAASPMPPNNGTPQAGYGTPYQNHTLPSNFVPPQTQIPSERPGTYPAAPYQPHYQPHSPSQVPHPQAPQLAGTAPSNPLSGRRRRLND